jgi:hypothetical protein
MMTSESTPPRWVLPLQLLYLIGLVLLAVLYHEIAVLRRVFPSPSGSIPLYVPWWGALGGITISCTGIFRNAAQWNRHYNSWHLARPFLGAVAGSVGYLVFITIIQTTGAALPAHSEASSSVFALVAFLVGYREEVFRELLRTAVDTLIAPGRNRTTTKPTENGSGELGRGGEQPDSAG